MYTVKQKEIIKFRGRSYGAGDSIPDYEPEKKTKKKKKENFQKEQNESPSDFTELLETSPVEEVTPAPWDETGE